MTVQELLNILQSYDRNETVYIRTGFNRFQIQVITAEENNGLELVAFDDADNPIIYSPNIVA